MLLFNVDLFKAEDASHPVVMVPEGYVYLHKGSVSVSKTIKANILPMGFSDATHE
jgi:hypothetical protein